MLDKVDFEEILDAELEEYNKSKTKKKAPYIGYYYNKKPTAKREWALKICLDHFKTAEENYEVIQYYLDLVGEHKKPIVAMLTHDSSCLKADMKYFDAKYYRRVPTPIWYYNILNTMPSNMVNAIQKAEHDILYNSNYADMVDLSEKEEIKMTDMNKFAMKEKLISHNNKQLDRNDKKIVEDKVERKISRVEEILEKLSVDQLKAIESNIKTASGNGEVVDG